LLLLFVLLLSSDLLGPGDLLLLSLPLPLGLELVVPLERVSGRRGTKGGGGRRKTSETGRGERMVETTRKRMMMGSLPRFFQGTVMESSERTPKRMERGISRRSRAVLLS